MQPSQQTFSCVIRHSLRLLAILSLAVFAILVQAADGQSTSEANNKPTDKSEIESILASQTKAWNDGDLEKFMQTYWKSEDLTFCSGGKTTRGWQATLDNYKTGYPNKSKMGHLHFDRLQITMIEGNSALVLGNWHLKMEDDSARDGNFSLVVKRIESQWKIIHDHSSALDAEPEGE